MASMVEIHPAEREAWENYWLTSGSSRCVPDTPGVAAALSNLWQDFARSLPQGAQLLDLGCGAGAVLEEISRARPDLKLVGVDFVESLPNVSRNYELKAAIRMEQLPFANDSFHALTSQFGFEYSETERSAGEAARVLRAGGLLTFVIHDRSGPIVKQGGMRGEALRWALMESGAVEIAERVIETRRSFAMPTPPALREAVHQARLRFPSQSVAAEILGALLQIVSEGEFEGPASSLRRLAWLREHARCELAMIAAMQRVAQDEQGIASFASRLSAAGLKTDQPDGIHDPSTGMRFAWLIRASKPSA